MIEEKHFPAIPATGEMVGCIRCADQLPNYVSNNASNGG